MKMPVMMFESPARSSQPLSHSLPVLVALFLLGFVACSHVSAKNLHLHEFDYDGDSGSGYQTAGEQSSLIASISFAGMGL